MRLVLFCANGQQVYETPIISEMQVKTTIDYHLTPVKMITVGNSENIRVDKVTEKNGKVNWHSY